MTFITWIQPNSELYFQIKFEKKFLHMNSYPPDYNRGFDIPSSIVRILEPKKLQIKNQIINSNDNHKNNKNNNDYTDQYIFLPQILILLPYPDMS